MRKRAACNKYGFYSPYMYKFSLLYARKVYESGRVRVRARRGDVDARRERATCVSHEERSCPVSSATLIDTMTVESTFRLRDRCPWISLRGQFLGQFTQWYT